ncbi:glycosyltransferase family 2 protein [Pseudomonas sp. MH10]|uniref:glycosyltransferase family 2 protein n=1 Tax=unclassified Pseudomonas TaxID=196821 RepID=UPI003A0FD190
MAVIIFSAHSILIATLSSAVIRPLHYLNNKRFAHVPDWPQEIWGVSYSPFRAGQSPLTRCFPSREEIRADLQLISHYTKRIRIYSVEGTQRFIPELAVECGLQVTLGAWICRDLKRNEQEIALVIHLANTIPSVKSIIIGNESLYRNDVPEITLINYLDRVRREVMIPVSTSEQWHIWTDFPQLADHVDFIASHILPFWENTPSVKAPAFLMEHVLDLKRTFPHKRLLLSEIGWPSKGGLARYNNSSLADQAIYLRTQLHALNQANLDYFVVEAFDQDWKIDEGVAGPRWGIFNAHRQQKFNLKGPIKRTLHWQPLISRMLGGPERHSPGRKILALLALLFYTGLVWAGFHYSQQYSLCSRLLLSLAWPMGISLAGGVEVREFIEATWTPRQSRFFAPVKETAAYRPYVSIHLPCYNEPPEIVKKTLDALSELNYANFEVLVIDNNTLNPNVWTPVKEHCLHLGSRFKFFHVEQLTGYKAGALNYLLPFTNPSAEIIAVIDADYCVDRNWLKHTVPHFSDSQIAVVQAPQNYRDAKDSLFKKCCYSEYRGFFNIGMVIRNDHNAIIQHGTMTLIRKSALERIGWAEWCICEDAELGLRLLESGYSTAYVRNSYGKGLVPDTFSDFKKQRFRWVYGAIQIIKHHRTALLTGKGTKLTLSQRYHFLAGWLPWIAEGVNLIITCGFILWSAAIIASPHQVHPLPWVFTASATFALLLKLLKVIYLYDNFVTDDIREAFSAIVAGFSLYPTIAKAVLYGFFTSNIPFFRTPKNADSQGMWVAISEAREELFIMLLLWGAALGICLVQGLPSADMRFWVTMLLVQSLPYLAALIMAFLSSLPKPTHVVEPTPA